MWCAVAVGALCWVLRGARGPGGVFAQDFGLRGILTANKLSKFRVSELGSGAAGTIRAERARARRSGAEAARNPSCPAAFREARSASHRGVRGVVPPGDMTRRPRSSLEDRGRRCLVEMSGVEPESSGTFPSLLRAQPATFFSAPAITQAIRRRAQSLFDFPAAPVTGPAS